MPESKKREQKEHRRKKEPLKVARVVYGTRSLADCMEAVIKIYVTDWRVHK